MYAVKGTDPLLRERLWTYTQYQSRDFYMYRTRLSRNNLVWVIEVPRDRRESLFLLQFAQYVDRITHTYYS